MCNSSTEWESLKIEVDLYFRSGSYTLLRDARIRQAELIESDGELRIALAYYCMAFYIDLNGFENRHRLLYEKRSNFRNWTCTARIDLELTEKIFSLASQCGISEKELLDVFCSSAFRSKSFLYHIFTVNECKEILMLAKEKNISKIHSYIESAKARFLSEDSLANKIIAI